MQHFNYIDFAAYGDLPQISGRSGGLPTRIISGGPLIDDWLVGDFQNATALASQHAIIRTPIDVPEWFDRSFLDAALDDLRLQHLWRPRPEIGR